MSSVLNLSTEPLTVRELAALHNEALLLDSDMKTQEPESATVKHYLIGRQANGVYVLLAAGTRTGIVANQPERPSKYWAGANAMPAATALRSFLSRSDVWEKANDETIWKIAKQAAQDAGLTANHLRVLARTVAAALDCRAGLAAPTSRETV